MTKPALREGFVAESEEQQPKQPKQPEPPQDNALVDMTGAPVEAQEPNDSWPITVKLLRKSIFGNKRERLTELTFREPTGRDIVMCGNPVRIDGTGEIVVDEAKMTKMMAQLSGVLLPLLNDMHPVDWNSCSYRLRRFFLPDPTSW
jgi:hypothetical protein